MDVDDVTSNNRYTTLSLIVVLHTSSGCALQGRGLLSQSVGTSFAIAPKIIRLQVFGESNSEISTVALVICPDFKDNHVGSSLARTPRDLLSSLKM